MSKIKIDCGKLFAAMSFSLVFALLMSLACFDASCQEIRNNILRLHIVANSDSVADQKVKLVVRDALLSEFGDLFDGASTIDQAEQVANLNITKLQKIAKNALEKQDEISKTQTGELKLYIPKKAYFTADKETPSEEKTTVAEQK